MDGVSDPVHTNNNNNNNNDNNNNNNINNNNNNNNNNINNSNNIFLYSATLHRFQTKTILFCSGYSYRPHYNGSKTDRFENALQSGTI